MLDKLMNLLGLFLSLFIVTMVFPLANASTDKDYEETNIITPQVEPEPEPEKEPEDECANPDDEDNCIEGPEKPKPKPEEPEPEPEPEGTKCDDSYPDDCIAPKPPDLDCSDVGDNIKVTGSDPHDLDRDGNGVGCESEEPGPPSSSGGGSSKGGDDNNNGDGGKQDNNKEDSNDNPILDKLDKIFETDTDTATEKKFQVIVILNDTAKAEADIFRMRVVVYGPNTLHKPTLDKPGQIINIANCLSACYTEWGFTPSKVPLNSTVTACVWNPDSGNKDCGWDKSDSQYGPEVISIRLPSQKLTKN